MALLLALAGFLARWIWDRVWKKKDGDSTTLKALGDRMTAVEIRETSRERNLGGLEANHNKLEGKVDALQTFWRSEFAKLTDQFKVFEEKVDYRLDNFRLELRGDQQKSEERLTALLTGHQARVHDRLNAISAEQAKMLSEMVDMLVERAGEPRPSPALPKVD